MKRLYYIDNIRVILTILVIVHHTAIAYGAAGGWYYVDSNTNDITSTVLTLFTAVNQAYFMGFFFLISGYFTPASYDKKGAAAFLKDRLIRLGIPLLLYISFIGPTLIYFLQYKEKLSYIDFYIHKIFNLEIINWGPMWFVETLIYFAIFYAIYRKITREQAENKVCLSHKYILLSAVWIGLAAFFVRMFFPVGTNILGMQLGYFPSYIFLFIIGIMAKRYNWLDSLSKQHTRLWFKVSVTSIILLPVVLIAGGALEGNTDVFMGGMSFQSLAYALWEPFVAFGIIMTVIIFFRNHVNKNSTVLQMMSDSAYTAFIVHPPIVVFISIIMSKFHIAPFVKFLAVSIAGTIICFLISSFIIKIPYIRKVL
ncbi:acyltransferase family protein [Metabacillus fastidiosus]|uniref:acyltransferase family protein n=1 Tax=Metabacillus fastidiosus TaxID=1458 RepID=UPI002E1CFFDB|nr:acyltransferase family protein [Metabacillus fastidiosus]MED4452657.1 acyltransferase family protein [Metabacillus fastidiosus]